METQGPHIRVVGATIDHAGQLRDVVAVAPPEATALTSNPDAFEAHGNVAILPVEQDTVLRQAGILADEIMIEDAKRHDNMWSRTVGSVALPGVVSLARLQQVTTHNLR